MGQALVNAYTPVHNCHAVLAHSIDRTCQLLVSAGDMLEGLRGNFALRIMFNVILELSGRQ